MILQNFVITQKGALALAKTPFILIHFLIFYNSLYRICSIFCISNILIYFCLLSLTIFKEVCSHLWE